MPREFFINKRTGSTAIISKRDPDKKMVQVEYIPSGMHSWYLDEDFERLFKKGE
jgi:hypothetical protein